MGCSSKAFKEPSAPLINKMLFLSLLSVHRHLSMHKMLSLSLKSLSLSSPSPLIMAYHGAGAQWQAGGALI